MNKNHVTIFILCIFGPILALIGCRGDKPNEPVDPEPQNRPPEIHISSPNNGASFKIGDYIDFEAIAVDPEEGTLTGNSIVWTSNKDGRIGSGISFTRDDLSVNQHTITATAFDSAGASSSDVITISITAYFELVGEYSTSGAANDVYVRDSHAFLADDSGFYVVNVSNPATPSLDSYTPTDLPASHVLVNDNYAYLTVMDYTYTPFAGSLLVFDISNLASPALVGHYDSLVNVTDICAWGSYLYVSQDVGLKDVLILDIANPASPQTAGIWDSYGSHANAVYAYNGLLFVVLDGFAIELEILDIGANPTQPPRASAIDLPWGNTETPRDVFVSESRAYLATGTWRTGTVWVYDVADPGNPNLISFPSASGIAGRVCVSDDHIFVLQLGESGSTYDNLEVVSHSANPAFRLSTNAHNIFAVGSLVFVADGNSGLRIVRFEP